jgi:hypothetical protein
MQATPDLKTCGRCKQQKPVDEFYRRAKGSEERQDCCKACTSAHNKQYRIENAARLAAKEKALRTERAAGDLDYYVKNNLWGFSAGPSQGTLGSLWITTAGAARVTDLAASAFAAFCATAATTELA